jgi:hypothetical protein
MLTFNSSRLQFVMGAALVVTFCVAPPCKATPAAFFLASTQPDNYVAVHLNTGHMLFTFSNLNNFSVQIDSVTVQDKYCVGVDCSNISDPNYQEDAITDPTLTEGTTCGVNAFLQPKKSCNVEAGFNLIDNRLPDPNTDYGEWGFYARVGAHRAGAPTVTGYGIQIGAVYVLDPGASTSEPSTLLLMLGAGVAVLLGKWRVSFLKTGGICHLIPFLRT